MTRVVVTGAKGQVGTEVVAECVARGYELAISTADITTLTELPPADVVVHCAALTDVDECERDPQRAHLVNTIGTRNVVTAARGAHVIMLSTDYVFDGAKALPYVESDMPNPINEYGRSKRSGELAVDLLNGAVIRTSWVNGAVGNNIAKTILRLLDEDQPIRFVTDQRGHPTIASDLATAIADFIHLREKRKGIWHVTNQGGVASWYDFAVEVVKAAGGDPARVEPVTTEDLPPRAARRPANSVLETEHEVDARDRLPDYRDSLPNLIEQIRANLRQ